MSQPATKHDWQESTLGLISDINPRETLKKSTIAKAIAMDRLLPFTRKIAGYETKAFSGGSKFRNGDTLLARITPCLENGKTAYVDILEADEVGFGSTEFIVIREKENISDKKFLYYFATSPTFREAAIRSMTGTSGRQRVQTDLIANKAFNFPSAPEQKAIGAVLSVLDDKIELLKAQNRVLEAIAQELFYEWFVEFNFPNNEGRPYKKSGGRMVETALGQIPADWKAGKLEDEFEIIMGQSPAGVSYNEQGAGMIFFQGRAEFQERFPAIRLHTTSPKKLAKKFDVLVSVRAPVGDINVAFTDCCIGRGLAAVRGENKSYTLYRIKSLESEFKKFESEGTVFGAITGASFKKIGVPIPEQMVSQSFEKIVSPMDRKIFANYLQAQHLITIRNRILPNLMNGTVRVKNF